ncbi:MAG: hypothetical protein AAGJ46_19560 [Planctomycetota bacterium]
MPSYLLPCQCGQSIRVEPRQAGEKVTCSGCSDVLEVPSLRQIRELPPAPDESAPRRSSWSARQGVLTAGMLVTAALIGVGAYFYSVMPLPPEEVNRDLQIAQGLEVITPLDGFQLWMQQYQPIFTRGQIEPFVDRRGAYYERALLMNQIYRAASFGLAAVIGLGAIAIAASIRGGK